MTEIQLPFQLKEGTKAYAAKVMANFNALIGKLNMLSINGDLVGDLEAFLTSLSDAVDNAVVASRVGNADEIRFADGDTMQEKLDSGSLNGKSGTVSIKDRMCYFYVDDLGHLHIVARDDVDFSAYTINSEGHLIYTIPPPDETLVSRDYDLGSVKGPKGDSGDMQASIYDTRGRKEDIFDYVNAIAASLHVQENVCFAYAANWEEDAVTGAVTCVVEAEGIDDTAKFDIGLTPAATEQEEDAFEKAQLKVSSQTAGEFTLTRKSTGITPTIDLPLVVRIYP